MTSPEGYQIENFDGKKSRLLYTLISDVHLARFKLAVQEHLDAGWWPHGDTTVTPDLEGGDSVGLVYSQAMMRAGSYE